MLDRERTVDQVRHALVRCGRCHRVLMFPVGAAQIRCVCTGVLSLCQTGSPAGHGEHTDRAARPSEQPLARQGLTRSQRPQRHRVKLSREVMQSRMRALDPKTMAQMGKQALDKLVPGPAAPPDDGEAVDAPSKDLAAPQHHGWATLYVSGVDQPWCKYYFILILTTLSYYSLVPADLHKPGRLGLKGIFRNPGQFSFLKQPLEGRPQVLEFRSPFVRGGDKLSRLDFGAADELDAWVTALSAVQAASQAET